MKFLNKYIFMLFAAILMLSCQEEILAPETVKDGYVSVKFMTDVPVMERFCTKAVDPDGGGVQQMQVFCFDANGIFITTVKAVLAPDAPQDGSTASMSGRVEAVVPEHAHILQLVGNQNLTFFEEDRFRGMTEIEVMSTLEASAGRMIYWARKTVAELRDCNTPEKAVRLRLSPCLITMQNSPIILMSALTLRSMCSRRSILRQILSISLSRDLRMEVRNYITVYP